MNILSILLATTSLAFSSDLGYQCGNEVFIKTSAITNFSIKSYFSNLYENQPYNKFGTCGFVSLVSVLSYADTFYNDNVIPSNYESINKYNSLDEANSKSPGVIKAAINESSNNPYVFFSNHYNDDYQSYLAYNFNRANGTNNASSFVCGTIPGNISNICDLVLPESLRPIVSELGWNHSQQEYISFIKSEIDKGRPVITSIYKHDSSTGTDSDYHSVVAYAYDQNGLYMNFGWGKRIHTC